MTKKTPEKVEPADLIARDIADRLMVTLTAEDLIFSAAFHIYLEKGYTPRVAAVHALDALKIAKEARANDPVV